MSVPALAVDHVSKVYPLAEEDFYALRDVSFEVPIGEYVALMGPSGSGKSTLMNLIGLLDTPTEGRAVLAGQDAGDLDAEELAAMRNRHVGFVFQSFHLLPRMSVRENVEVSLIYAGYRPAVRRRRALDMLERVGLSDRGDHRPSQLSGGQRQRVAIARALTMNPSLLLADEPTGNLDPGTAARVMDLLVAQTRQHGASLVLVTHSDTAAARADRVLRLRSDGIG